MADTYLENLIKKQTIRYWPVPGWAQFEIIAGEYGLFRLRLDSPRNNGLFESSDQHENRKLAMLEDTVHYVTARHIEEYLAGKRASFDIRIGFLIHGFQKIVFNLVGKIPYGCTVTYDLLASKIGMPNASNGVRNILIKNPLPLIIPCHRVIKSLSEPGNYVLGQSFKQRLLKLESIYKTKTASNKSVIRDSA